MKTALRIAIFGITGATGIALTDEALRRGHSVRGLVRPATTFSAPAGVEIFRGNFSDVSAVDSCLQGADTVFCVFGPRPSTRDVFCAAAIKEILAGMQRQYVSRLICQTGAMTVPDPQHVSLMMRWMSGMYRSQRPEMAEDIATEQRLVEESLVDWTIIKPPRLKSGNATGRVAVGPNVKVGMMSSLDRGDLVQVLLDVAEQGKYIREKIFIKGK
jgi:putative NADH-flavin reductase